jgi:hypothetical protein
MLPPTEPLERFAVKLEMVGADPEGTFAEV